jgi:RHS repeat-associated protein
MVYDGGGSDANTYADFDGSGNLLTRYLYAPAVDALLARTSSGGTTAWYLPDKLGSIRDIADTTGAVIDHVVYNSFGGVNSETNSANGDRFKLTGREYDSTAKLYHYRARFYDSVTGRFVSQDPMGFAAGDSNLYRYVANDPVGDSDPSGLDNAGPNGGTLKMAPGVTMPPGTEIKPENDKLPWQPFDPKKIPPNVDALVLPGKTGGLLKIPNYADVTITGFARSGKPIYSTTYRARWPWRAEPQWFPARRKNPFNKRPPRYTGPQRTGETTMDNSDKH